MKQPKGSNVTPITAATRGSKPKTISTQTAGSATTSISGQSDGAGGGHGDWATSVEARLSELRSDVRNLLIGGGFIALALAGVGWTVYNSTNEKLQNMAVTQQAIQGKIDTLDAKMAGRFDALQQQLDDKTKAGPSKR